MNQKQVLPPRSLSDRAKWTRTTLAPSLRKMLEGERQVDKGVNQESESKPRKDLGEKGIQRWRKAETHPQEEGDSRNLPQAPGMENM